MRRPLTLNMPVEEEEAEEIGNCQNEGMLPARQSVPVGRQICQFVEGWKRITNDPYVLKYRSQGYRLHFTSPSLLLQTPWEIDLPRGPRRFRECESKYP